MLWERDNGAAAAMTQRILLLQGHPDRQAPHFCHALADHYCQGAEANGHEVRQIEIAALDVPLLQSQREWQDGDLRP